MRRQTLIPLFMSLLVVSACGSADDATGYAPDVGQQPVLEESDIYKIEGGLLYALIGGRALRVFDVTRPQSPSLLGKAELPAQAGELYVRDGVLLAVVDNASCHEGWVSTGSGGGAASGAVVVLDARDPKAPSRMGCTSLSGQVVASRMSDRHLFVVTSTEVRSFALSETLSLESKERHALTGQVAQAHFTANQLFIVSTGGATGGGGVAEPCDDGWCDYDVPEPVDQADSMLQVAAISASTGTIELQGAVGIEGTITGRFHMDARGTTFRLVTYRWDFADSLLQIVDVGDPWRPRRRGSLSLGVGEELKGTRFVEDRVYVVTFRQIDPLWVVDLSDPDAPTLLSELEVPGWSDFLFPRGDTLLTVGRGDGGGGVAVSLFDVSDPRQPRLLRQLTTSDWGTGSEANIDHRGVTLIESDDGSALLALPIASFDYQCRASSELRLLDVTATDISPRGRVEQEGTIRRSFLLQGNLLSLSGAELVALDIQDRDAPRVLKRVEVGAADEQLQYCMHDDIWMEGPFHCQVGGSPAQAWPLGLLFAIFFVAGRRRAKRSLR